MKVRVNSSWCWRWLLQLRCSPDISHGLPCGRPAWLKHINAAPSPSMNALDCTCRSRIVSSSSFALTAHFFLLSTVLPSDLCDCSSCCSLSSQVSQFEQPVISFWTSKSLLRKERKYLDMMKKSSRQDNVCIFKHFRLFSNRRKHSYIISHQLYNRFPSGFSIQSDEQVLYFCQHSTGHFRVSCPKWWIHFVLPSPFKDQFSGSLFQLMNIFLSRL